VKRCVDCKFFDARDSSCDRKLVWGMEPDTLRGGHRRVLVKSDPMIYRPARDERASVMPWRCGFKARHFQSL